MRYYHKKWKILLLIQNHEEKRIIADQIFFWLWKPYDLNKRDRKQFSLMWDFPYIIVLFQSVCVPPWNNVSDNRARVRFTSPCSSQSLLHPKLYVRVKNVTVIVFIAPVCLSLMTLPPLSSWPSTKHNSGLSMWLYYCCVFCTKEN